MYILSLSEKTIKTIKSITNSQYLDIIGLAIVLLGSIYLGYHKAEVPIHFNSTTYTFPLGIFSMISTRLVTKKKYWKHHWNIKYCFERNHRLSFRKYGSNINLSYFFY